MDISFETSAGAEFELVSNTSVDMTNYESSGSQFSTNEIHLSVTRPSNYVYDLSLIHI